MRLSMLFFALVSAVAPAATAQVAPDASELLRRQQAETDRLLRDQLRQRQEQIRQRQADETRRRLDELLRRQAVPVVPTLPPLQ